MNENTTPPKGLQLDRIAFYGRTFDEYCQLFGIDETTLSGKQILDVAGGSASFTAEANQRGVSVTACDPRYADGYDALAAKGNGDIDYMLEQMNKAGDQFDWSFYGDLTNRGDYARRSLNRFLLDYDQNPQRYVPGSLPSLPFADKSFDSVLSAHFLFVYGDWFDADFIVASLKECCRVAREAVRIYPLIRADGSRYPAFDEVMARMKQAKVDVHLESSSFRFVKTATHRFILRPPR
jgi:hypothetical protein